MAGQMALVHRQEHRLAGATLVEAEAVGVRGRVRAIGVEAAAGVLHPELEEVVVVVGAQQLGEAMLDGEEVTLALLREVDGVRMQAVLVAGEAVAAVEVDGAAGRARNRRMDGIHRCVSYCVPRYSSFCSCTRLVVISWSCTCARTAAVPCTAKTVNRVTATNCSTTGNK